MVAPARKMAPAPLARVPIRSPRATPRAPSAARRREVAPRSVPVVNLPPALPALDHADLLVIAELGYHYLMSGGLDLAHEIFSSLEILAPQEPYFPLALALVADRMGDKSRAHRAYERAARLAPSDPRPDLNRAELFIEAGDRESARALLTRALEKARRARSAALAAKAEGLLRHLGRNR